MCCDTERAKAEKREAKRREAHANRTPDEIRKSLEMLRAVRAGDRSNLSAAIFMSFAPGEIDMAAVDAEIAKEEALLNAEYDRQFPNGPTPMITIKRGDGMEMDLLRHVLHVDVLNQAFGPGGGGIAEIEDRAAEARSLQALHDAAEKKGATT